MNVDELIERVKRSPHREHVDWFRQWHRPAVDIIAVEGEVPVGGSRFGGAPDLPHDLEWPVHDKGPYRFLAQIDLVELAPICRGFRSPWSNVLPRDGLLSLFVADDPTGEMDPEAEIYWGDPRYAIAILTPPGTRLVRHSSPPPVDFGAPTGITFEPTIDIPYDEEQVAAWPIEPSEEDWRGTSPYYRIRDALHGPNYLFGYPTHSSLGYDPTPAGHVPLLTLDSDDERVWQWHDGDRLMLFMAPGAPTSGRFSLAADAG